MMSRQPRALITALCVVAGCSAPAPTTVVPAAPPESIAAPAVQSESIARADALVEDMRRREAAQAAAATTAPSPDQELWWKNRILAQQARVQAKLDCMTAAVARMKSADADADADNARADGMRCGAEATQENEALEKIIEEGRRANVPDAWLRWP